MIDSSMPLSRCSRCGSQRCSDDCGEEVFDCAVCGKTVAADAGEDFGPHGLATRCADCAERGLVAQCVACGDPRPFLVPEGRELVCLACLLANVEVW